MAGSAGPFDAAQGRTVAQTGGQPAFTNRLVNEKSPYLQLHAHNPVDWYPWGPEAFEKARREGKPIFLSIGYSTCHWCHVMEAETFSDPAMADLMNRSVVSIKVDREERPDVDRVYMSYVQWYYGGGGWPLTVMLTPDRKPFSGATYLPPDDRDGRQGFRSWLTQLSTMWANDRRKLLDAANTGTQMVAAQSGGAARAASAAIARALEQTYTDISGSFDAANGGFGAAPKFPRPVLLNFLLRDYARTGNKRALEMTLQTLVAIANGGIHDHLGGGFHRYSTDREWHVPHFEKMLYDQAQLAVSYLEAYQITKGVAFAGVARDILDYVARDMRGPEGGFFSAEDADSLARVDAARATEGAYYVWTSRRDPRGRRRRACGRAGVSLRRAAGGERAAEAGRPGRAPGQERADRPAYRRRDRREVRHIGRQRARDARGGAAEAPRRAGGAAASSARRQGADVMERHDAVGVRARRAGVRRAALSRCRAGVGPFHRTTPVRRRRRRPQTSLSPG